MTRIQKGSKFNLRNLLGKTREENDLGMKVLRYVMAVGFVLSPWLGGEAYAEGNGIVRAGTDKPNLIGYDGVANVANIYAEKAANGVGLNAFTHFELGNNQIANMYFKTSPTDANTLHTLVNTVENQISISGTVNAIRNNEVGGNLYFLSPNGMVVGAGGVINAGSLTMITSGKTFYDTKGALDPAAAAAAVSANNWTLDSTAPISIQGQINTAGGIDLRAVSISMSKSTTKGDVAPALKTGMVFEQVVNTQGLNTYKAKAEERLTAAEVNGEIKLYTKYDSANSENSGKIALSDGAVDAVGNVYIEADRAAAMVSADIDASGNIEIIANRNRSNGDDIGEVTLVNSDVYAGGNINIVADKSINLQSTIIQAGGTIDFASKWYQNDYSPYTHGGTLTVDGGSISANGYIYADAGKKIEIKNGGSITSDSELTIQCLANGGSSDYYSELVLTGGTVSGNEVKIDVDDKIVVNKGASIASTVKMNVNVEQGEIVNKGSIIGAGIVNLQSQHKDNTSNGNINNEGIIESTGGTLKLTANDNLTNTGTIQAKDQITFEVANTITNRGDIVSTYSNVQAHIGRDFYNLAKSDTKYGSGVSSAKDGRIIAGGNVQVDYPLERPASQNGTYGIYNSGLIQANGNSAPESEGGVVDKETGSGNIWLTSSYNITNYGNMIAGRQITLNARDFLDNYGLIQGVTYLDIKSIMGYVYNHGTDNNGNAMEQPGRIISTGGNIDLSSGQANLSFGDDISKEEQEAKKEAYRKFTPIIIEGIVEATSDDDVSNQTRKGNIKITSYLGDIYINGGTIETKPELGTNKEVKAEAGDVILDAAQNITIGFQTEKVWADDPTTQAGPNGENKDKYERDDEREYFINTSTLSQKAAEITGTNITLTSGSGKTISMSAVNNTLTASNAITINTDSMNIVGGTFNAGTLKAVLAENGALNITGGTINVGNVNSNRALSISGGTVGKNDSALSIVGTGDVSIGSGAIVRTSSDVSIASDEGAVTNNSELNISGSVALSGKTDVTNSANITAGKDVSMTATTGKVNNSKVVKANGGNINLTGGTSINLQEGYGLEASDTINLTTDNMQITSGTIKANTLAASEALTLTGGTINAANISAGTNLIHNGATITADNDVTISAGNNINLQSGRLTANGAAFVVTNGTAGANSIVESASGYNLGVGSLSLSANQGNITLKGTDNVFQSVTLADVGGNVEIVNGNDTNKNVLTVSTAEGTTVGGIINIVNKGEGITVAGINATNNVSLTADKGIAVTGSFTTTGDVVLDADTYISIAGDVNAANASFGAGVDFIHNSGAIAGNEVVVTAGRNVQLNGGSMVAGDSASLTAGTSKNLAEGQGFIAEQAGYAIDAPQLTIRAAKYAALDSTANQLVNVDATQVGGDLTIGSGNTKSDAALQIATADTIQGNLAVINYASNGDAKANEIIFGNNLNATENIVLNNQETDINIGQGLTITSANEGVTTTSAGNVNVAGTVEAAKNASLVAGKGMSVSGSLEAASASMQAGENIALSGTITVNNVNLDAAQAISQTAGSIVATNTVATAGSDLSLASSANKLQNVTVTADDGSVTIVSGNDAEGALKVKTDGTIGGALSITNVANGVENDIVIDNDLLANGSITINNQEAGINLGEDVGITSHIGGINITALKDLISAGIINAVNDVILKAINNNLNMSGGSITATGGSIALHGKGGINNGASIAAKGNVGLYSTGGRITNSADITAGKNFASATRRAAFYSLRAVAQDTEETGSVIIEGNGGVTNNAGATISAQDSVLMSSAGDISNSSTVTATTGSVEINGDGGVTNNAGASISAGLNVGLTAATGDVSNSGTIQADKNVGLTATTGAVTNSNNVSAGTGTVTMSGSSVDNTANITAGSDVSMNATAGNVQNSGTIAADQSVGMTADEGTVKNSNTVSADGGTVTMSGKTGVVNNNSSATISAGSGVSMTSSDEGVTNSSTVTSTSGSVEMNGQTSVINIGAVTANGGSVTMSGSGGVTNDANITAKDSVSMTSSAGAVDNSNAITVSNGSVTMTGQTSVNNEGELKATGGSVEISGNGGVTNGANITANENVNISAYAGAITNSGSVTANTGDISLKSDKGITSTDSGASLKTESLNGSISAATTYGEVNISEINASKTASVSSEYGSVKIGSVSGNDVVLSSGPSSSGGSGDGSEGSEPSQPSIKVVGTATVGNSLKLQGDNIDVSNVVPDDNTKSDPLNIDVSGADGAGSAVQGSLDLNITGDVVFDNLNVKNANVTASGNIDVNKLRVEGEGETTLVSNKTEGDENGTKVTVVGKDATPPAGSNVIVDPGNDSGNWLNIKMDEEGSKTTVVDDAGRDVNNKDYPAQMSAKLVDYDPYDTYLDHYADMADIFSRSYLIDAPERSSSDILFPAQGGRIVLKQDANGLHLEISEEDKEA